jgi:hypothetical protein
MKKIILFLLVISGNFLFGQAGAKWAADLNIIGSGDAFGTKNNFPILFYANNSLKMTLNTNGDLNLNSLSGVGNRVLLTDANGNLYALPQGTPGQFLQSDGTWGNLPLSATSWSLNGNDIFNTNSGKVGIGTNSPQFILDVNGDARIKNNLYVEGKILISDRVESGILRSDWKFRCNSPHLTA